MAAARETVRENHLQRIRRIGQCCFTGWQDAQMVLALISLAALSLEEVQRFETINDSGDCRLTKLQCLGDRAGSC
jgi:hypothetical protein